MFTDSILNDEASNRKEGLVLFKRTAVLIPLLLTILGFGSSAFGLELDHSHRYVDRLDVGDWGQKTSTADWRLLTQVRRYDRVTDSSTVFGTAMSGTLQYKFYDELRFYGVFSAIFQTGNAQSRFGDLTPRTGVFVSESYFLVSPFAKSKNEFFTLEVGALNQSRTVGNKVLISGNAFPGVSEALELSMGSFKLTLRAQQMIPYSQVENAELSERERTPYFLTESLKLKFKQKNYNASIKGGLFNYSELPSAVAFQSQILGNSVTGDQINAEFLYDFGGWFATFNFDAMISKKLLMQFKANLVENLDAPETLNRGQDFYFSLNWINSKNRMGPFFGVFSLEPDVSPAFYNTSAFGNNNRDGWYAGFDLFVLKPSKMKFGIEYVDANLLNPGVLQEDQDSIVVTFQTHFKKLGAW